MALFLSLPSLKLKSIVIIRWSPYLSVLDELGKIFLADPILWLDVEQDYSEIETQVESQPKATSILQVSKMAAHTMSVRVYIPLPGALTPSSTK